MNKFGKPFYLSFFLYLAMNYTRADLKYLCFIDIETVSFKAKFEELDPLWQDLWRAKAARIQEGADEAELYEKKAAIFSEFGKVVAIGMGMFYMPDKEDFSFRVKVLSGEDEAVLLAEFCELIGNIAGKNPKFRFVAHNGLEFDYPYLCRRLLANGLPLPKPLQITGKKSWDIQHLDTMELWKFGDRKNFTSLNLLACVFDLPSSKEQLDGSQVGHYYYQIKDLDSIANYCAEDVVLTARVFLKLVGLGITLDDERIVKV